MKNKKNKILWAKKDYIKYLINKYFNDIIGLSNSQISLMYKSNRNEYLNYLLVNFPKYERLIFNNINAKITYHISGYSENIYNSIERLMGECVERYSAIMSHFLYKSEMISRNSIKNNETKNFLDFKFINIYSPDQKNNINKKLHWFGSCNVNYETDINYIKFKNYIDKKEYFIPYQSFFMCGYAFDKKAYNFEFSTGTATHTSYEKSLINSFSEIFQIHNFMKFWYFQNIDYFLIDDVYFDQTFNDDKIYWIYVPDDETEIITVISIIESQKFPYYSVGIQGSYNINLSIKRSYEEALAIQKSSKIKYVFDEKSNIDFEKHSINNQIDIDSNVFYWASNYNNVPKKYFKNLLKKAQNISIKNLLKKQKLFNCVNEEISFILKKSHKIFKYLFIKEITSPEFIDDYIVTKVYIPELFTIFIPSIPPKKHPFIKSNNLKFKKNWIPHPLP